MLNQSVRSVEKKVSDAASRTIAGATQVAEDFGAGMADTAEATMNVVKSEVEQISRATREVAARVGAEVVKRPLTYTLAAAGAGAIIGVGLMALLNRPRHASH